MPTLNREFASSVALAGGEGYGNDLPTAFAASRRVEELRGGYILSATRSARLASDCGPCLY